MLILERGRMQRMPEVERSLFNFNVDSYRPNYEPYMTRAVAHVQEEETRMTREVGATFLDLTRIFEGSDGQIFTDYAHFTPHGNEVIAQYVATRIRPMLAERIRRLEAGNGAQKPGQPRRR